MKQKKIAIISRTDSSFGGAGVVADELTKLININSDNVAHLWRGFTKLPPAKNVFDLYANKSGRFFYKLIRYISRKLGVVDFIPLELLTHSLTKPSEYDLYHFHSISAAASPFFLRWIGKRKPTVWTFHDCSPFTGGCIYPSESNCQAFTKRCGDCPQLGMWPFLTRFDFTGFAQDYKRKMARESLFVPVVSSHWLAKEVVKSGMFDKEPIVIPNCVDTQFFKPIDKQEARTLLDLPQDQFVILMGAAFLSNERKGIKYAIDAISKLDTQPYVVAIGGQSDDLLKQNIPIHCAGYIKEKKQLALYYSAADVFVFPTTADNHPLAAIEAMACGTPVIGFRTGGVPEIVDHDVNGWLVEPRDVSGLVEALNAAMCDTERLQIWAQNGLTKVKESFSPDLFLKRHLDLYENLLSRGVVKQ